MKPKLVQYTNEYLQQRKLELENAIENFRSLEDLKTELYSVKFLLGEDNDG